MSHFFCFDVETGTRAYKPGYLHSIGCYYVNPAWEPADCFYIKIAGAEMDDDTADWWATQEEESPLAFREMFDDTIKETPLDEALQILSDWVDTACHFAPVEERIFVANPVAYDYAQIAMAFAEIGLEMPWSYRSICLRSAAWGADENRRPGASFRVNSPDIPHHALHDAYALAQDLRWLLNRRRPAAAE